MLIYRFHGESGEYLGAEEAFRDPLASAALGRDIWLMPPHATRTPPPSSAVAGEEAGGMGKEAGKAAGRGVPCTAVWNGAAWELREDHRRRHGADGLPLPDSGTAFWLPGDGWDSPPRYMSAPGPLPSGARLTRPAKPAEVQDRENREAELAEKLAFLKETDWYAVRAAETGTPIPEPVRLARQQARERVGVLRAQRA